MPTSDFDIYQTENGYTAVTNEVRRTILNALSKKERQLPELVKITKKAKPTLSSVHMKDLLEQRLIEEVGHPTDKRKKIYRLIAKRIGSSNLPVDQLRIAVAQYARLSPLASRVPLANVVDVLAAAPPQTSDETMRHQARRLGALSAPAFTEAPPREIVTNLAALLEREGLARTLRIDLEKRAIDLEIILEQPDPAPDARLAAIIAGLVEGLLHAREGGATARVHLDAPRRFRLDLVGLG